MKTIGKDNLLWDLKPPQVNSWAFQRRPPLPSVQEAESPNSVLSCHSVKLEQATTFSEHFLPICRMRKLNPLSSKAPPHSVILWERNLYSALKKWATVSLQVLNLGEHRSFSNVSFGVLDAGQSARKRNHGMQLLEGSSFWSKCHCFSSVDCRVRKLKKEPGTPPSESNSPGLLAWLSPTHSGDHHHTLFTHGETLALQA